MTLQSSHSTLSIANENFVIRVSESWKGYANLKYLFIFGDSYSSIGRTRNSPKCTPENPLGVPFPGQCFTEWPTEPNWVGHLVKWRPNADGQETEAKTEGHRLLVYDYAVGGETVDDVARQVKDVFMGTGGEADKPEWAPWTAEDSLFVVWVGINDCGSIMYEGPEDLDDPFTELSDVLETLYAVGARNFLLIDLPPIHRSPAFPASTSLPIHEIYDGWNARLRSLLSISPSPSPSSLPSSSSSPPSFSTSHPDTTILLYSSHATFTRILDQPTFHGFPKSDIRLPGGKVWVDHLHPTGRVHGFVARDVRDFLSGVRGWEGDEKDGGIDTPSV